jgi:DNA polymerase (family 10)
MTKDSEDHPGARATNVEIARVLGEIGSILELKGENPFKIRAYHRAADAVAELPQQLASLRRQAPLTALPGIGAGIAEKIGELLDTGECRLHQDLLDEMPSGLIELLRIPEVGPKTVRLVYRELGVSTLDELERAIREQRLRTVKGMGPKTEQNMLEGIALVRRARERLPLARAYPLAQSIMEALRAGSPVDRISPAGSLRRMRDTIGDIDILVASREPERAMEVFTSLPMVKKVIARGPTKSTVMSASDVQVDVRVLEPDSFGAGLQYFTGSKAHNIKLRELAEKRGFKLSEYGIFRAATGERVGGRTEEEMYSPLGLALVPPEIREDAGEIEAAQQGRLPHLVELAQIRGDLHMHTDATDGRSSLEEMVEAAQAKGYQYIGIANHSQHTTIAGGLTEDQMRRHIDQVRTLASKLTGFHLLIGAEVDILGDGALDYRDELLAELDYAIGSVHSQFKMPEKEMTARLCRAIENPFLDIIGHPTGRVIGEREPYAIDLREVLTAAATAGVAMEVNAFPDRLDLKDIHCRLARAMGVRLVINTDSHSARHLDMMSFGVATARRGWVEADGVLNTLPHPGLVKALRRNRGRVKSKQ